MTVLITGSNKGIGFEIARLFGKNDYKSTVIVTSRNMELGFAAMEKLLAEFPETKYELVQLDLCDPKSRASAIETVKSKHGTIDVLINNAGFAYPAASTLHISQQAQDSFSINYFATKAFTEEIISIVTQRLINVGSRVSNMSYKKCGAKVQAMLTNMKSHSIEDVDNMANDFLTKTKTDAHQDEYSNTGYGMSKVCLRALTEKQAELYSNLKVYQGCPGWCKTNMGGEKAPSTATEGADVFWWLATTDDESVLNKSGGFFAERKENFWTSTFKV